MLQAAAGQQPPIINFFQRPVEDRESSVVAGHYVSKDEDWIEIIPFGSNGKASVERPYSAWLAMVKQNSGSQLSGSPEVAQYNPSRFPQEWIDRIIIAFDAWKKGIVLPIDGTPVLNWPALSPAEAKNCHGAGFQTVEQLAEANEEGIRNLGMGGRTLKQRAAAWVSTKNDPAAKTSAKVAALEADKTKSDALIADLQQKVAVLASQIPVAPALKAV